MTNVSIGFGTWGLGGDAYGELSDRQSLLILDKAYDLGVRDFDTSPSYGDGLAEIRLGKFIKKSKKDVNILTKVGMLPHSNYQVPYDFSPNYIFKSVESSLQRLKIEQIDTLQLHSPVENYSVQYPEVFSNLETLLKSGKVKKIGISLKSTNYLDVHFADFPWDTIQFNFSLLDQRIFSQSTIKDKRFLQTQKIARTPLHFGFLTKKGVDTKINSNKVHLSKWPTTQLKLWEDASKEFNRIANLFGLSLTELALLFIKSSGLVNLIIPGSVKLEDLIENTQSFHKPNLSQEIINEVKKTYIAFEQSLNVKSPYQYVQS